MCWLTMALSWNNTVKIHQTAHVTCLLYQVQLKYVYMVRKSFIEPRSKSVIAKVHTNKVVNSVLYHKSWPYLRASIQLINQHSHYKLLKYVIAFNK